MDDKHKLTEKLKVLETEIYNAKIDLSGINSKLNISYEYEDNLAERQNSAKKATKELRKEFFSKSSEITRLYNKMTDIFKVFTGNFYRGVEL